jgi:hypothetical protein
MHRPSHATSFDNSPAAGLLHRLKTCYPVSLTFHLNSRSKPDAFLVHRPEFPITFPSKSPHSALKTHWSGHQNDIHVGECGGFVGVFSLNSSKIAANRCQNIIQRRQNMLKIRKSYAKTDSQNYLAHKPDNMAAARLQRASCQQNRNLL